MLNNDVEKNIAIILLNEPNLINTIKIEPNWLQIPLYKNIVMLFQNEITTNLMEVYSKLKRQMLDTNFTYNDIVELSKTFHKTSELEYLATELELNYLRSILFELEKEHERFPTKELEEQMFNILTVMQKIAAKTVTGNISETLNDLEYDLNHNSPQGIMTYSQLRGALGGGLRGGNLIIIGARPAVGKSAWALNLIQTALNQDPELRIDIFSAEMDKKEVLRRFISLKTGIGSDKLKNPNCTLTEKEKIQVKNTIDYYRNTDIKVHNQTFLNEILRTIRNRASEVATDKYLVVIDYIGLLRIANSKRDRRLEIEEITRELKVAATELNIPIIALSQLSRGIEQRQIKRPMLSDLRESGSIEQDANVVGFLYQDLENEKEYPQTGQRDMILNIAKNRDGSTEDIYFKFFPKKMLFEEDFCRL